MLRALISGQNLIFSWPTNIVGFTLEASSSLGTGATWTRATLEPAINGTNYSLKLPLSGQGQFYRLRGL